MVAVDGRRQVPSKAACSMISEKNRPKCCRIMRAAKCDSRKSLMRLRLDFLLVLLSLAGLCGVASSAQIVYNDINSVDSGDSANKDDPVKVLWGIADTSTAVGKVFSFHIPQETFEGNVHSYRVVESGKDALPRWLTFDKNLRAVKGIPGPGDKGQYNLEVVARNDDTNSEATDIFSLVVKDDSPHVSSSKPLKSMGKTAAKAVNCQAGDPITMVTIVVDTDLDQLLPQEKFDLAHKLTSHLNIAAEMLKMAPVGDQAKFDSSALVAGPGDTKSSKFSGAFLSWLVGCGKVEPDHMPVLQKVETSSANGEMSNAIGLSVVGWHVTNSRLKPTVKRVRRQVHATATAGLTLAPPSKLPVATVTSTDTEMTRVVPSMVSPTFSDIEVTQVKPPPIRPTSAEQRPPEASKVDIRPSKVVVMEATKAVTDDGHIMPSKTYTDIHKHRSQVLEPSVVMPESEVTRKTDMLPPVTEMTKEPTGSTHPTEATRVPTVLTTTRTPSTRPTPRRTPRPTTRPKPVHPFTCPEDGTDRHPDVWVKIKNITINVGDHLRFKIPENAFYDCEDGNTSALVVDVFTHSEDLIKDEIKWLRYEKKKQLLSGLPLGEDGDQVYKLLAVGIDSKGAVTRQSFQIEVRGANEIAEKVNHEFAFTIDYDYDKFMSNPRNRIDLTNKIARLYGDKNPKRMTVTKIERGSVIYSWTNNTLPTDDCPVDGIVNLMSKFLTKNLTLTEDAKQAMAPYTISKAAAVPQGSCADVDFDEALQTADISPKAVPESERTPTPPYKTVPPESEPEPKPEDGDTSPSKPDEEDSDIWITTVVPAVVIVAILFIALIIACILYRKKRKGKMNMQDHHTFVNKGVPIIFADELEEKPSDSSKPLIMEEEKPPNPPPEYHRSSSESPGSTPPSNHKDRAAPNEEDQEMDENDVTSPLYRPPPPVTASSENKQPRPHVQPAYRNPPPYVPP